MIKDKLTKTFFVWSSFIVLSICLNSCGLDLGPWNGGTGDVNNYFPLSQGNMWGYSITSSRDGVWLNDQFKLVKVTGTKDINGYSAVVLSSMSQSNADTAGEEYVTKTKEALVIAGTNTPDPVMNALCPRQLFRLPLRVNDTFVQVDKAGIDYGTDLDLDGINESVAIHSEVTVVGFEPVTVGAGTFNDCVKIQTTMIETLTSSKTHADMTVNNVTTDWYAPGIGPVKKHVENSNFYSSTITDYSLESYYVDGNRSETNPPTVSSVEPVADETAGASVTIQAFFSEMIDPFSINDTTFIVSDAENHKVTGEVYYYNKMVTFLPSVPIVDGNYTVTVTTGIQDLAGNPLQSDYSWSFMVDATPPGVVATTPPADAINVPLSTPITVTFSDDIDETTLKTYSFIVSSAGQVDGTMTYSNRIATFTPNTNFERNTIYTVTLTTIIKDKVGNPLPENYTWSFTTEPGLFLSYTATHTGSWPEAVAIGDVNNDGKNDVVLTTSFYFDSANDYKVFVFLQNASGGLDSPVKYDTNSSICSRPETVAIGDLNNDGRNDVAIGCFGSGIEVFLQNDSGTLNAGLFYASSDSEKIRIADLNNDGLSDIVGIGWGTNTASIWLQNESGTLNAPVIYSVTHGGYDDLEVSDINNDGLTDIVVMSGQSWLPNLGILTQNTNGTFTAPIYYSVDGETLTQGVAVGDINGDNLVDIVVTYGGNSGKIGVFYQNTSGTLNPVVSYSSYDIPSPAEIADVSGDGRKDVIVAHDGWSAVGIYQQNADGTLQKEDRYSACCGIGGNPQGLAVGDINGDGLKDIVLADYNGALGILYHSPLP
jgi:FG-GAP repeat.